MKTEDIDKTRPSKWVPLTDLKKLVVLGKLLEELGELTSIVSRTIIQGGLDKLDPETGEPNYSALQNELADVKGLSNLTIDYLALDCPKIEERATKKYNMKVAWLEMLDEP